MYCCKTINFSNLHINRKKTTIHIFLFIFCVIAFYLSGSKYLDEFNKGDAWVAGSIMKNRMDGLSTSMPFSRSFVPKGNKFNSKVYDFNIKTYQNADIFQDDGTWVVYKSAIRSPIIFYILYDNFLANLFNSYDNLVFFKIITCLLLCIVLSFFILWIYLEFGFFTALFCIISILLTPLLIKSSTNILGSFWLKLLPLVLGLWILRYEEQKNKYISKVWLSIYIFIFVAICQSISYEHTAMILISGTLPFFYYGIKNQWNIKKFAYRFSVISASSIFAFGFIISLHFFTLSLHLNSSDKAKDYFKRSFFKRSNYSNDQLTFKVNSRIQKCLKATIPQVINSYLKDKNIIWKYNVENTLYLTIIGSVVFSIYAGLSFLAKEKILKFLALITLVVVAFFGVIAGLIIFKSHAACHKHLDFVFWCISFSLICPVLIGFIFQELFLDVIKRINEIVR